MQEKNTWNNIAKIYEDKFMSMNIYNSSYDKFCLLLPQDAALLELGCGPGNITNYLHNSHPKFQILATDYAPKMIELAEKNVPKAKFQVLDARKVNTLSGKFDGIIAGFILPYFTKKDVHTFFQNCKRLLSTKGVFYFSFVVGKEEDSLLKKGSTGDELFFRYHEKEFIEKARIDAGFSLLEQFEIAYEDRETHTAIIVQKID